MSKNTGLTGLSTPQTVGITNQKGESRKQIFLDSTGLKVQNFACINDLELDSNYSFLTFLRFFDLPQVYYMVFSIKNQYIFLKFEIYFFIWYN